jgi:hypothetical protein
MAGEGDMTIPGLSSPSLRAIRANPWAHWAYIPEVVRPYFRAASDAGKPCHSMARS